ncbi:MAG TPA: hypothetical protein VE133_16855, partial [Candidatus Sulfotelmatobacter sp.]|nr:hypothetical protein [Candidatus Sulfotelmatobacter sp.]
MTKYPMLTAVFAAGVLSVASLAQQAAPATAQPTKKTVARLQTFTGEISDGQCAEKGSHQDVMKKASVNSVANCVKGCARRHGFVLYDPATKKVYKLSDQERPAEQAGRRVKIKGALDKSTQTIYVSSIEPA